MDELVIKNVKEFIDFLFKNKKQQEYVDIMGAYHASLGGCRCNKKTREEFTKSLYESFKERSSNLESLIKIRDELNLKSITLESDGKFIIKI